jgi:hypothetical protein
MEVVSPQHLHHYSDVLQMFRQGVAVDENVIEENQNKLAQE